MAPSQVAHGIPGKGAHTGFPAPGQGMLFRGTQRRALRFGTPAPPASQSRPSCSPHGPGAAATPSESAHGRQRGLAALRLLPHRFLLFFPRPLQLSPISHCRTAPEAAGPQVSCFTAAADRAGGSAYRSFRARPGRAGPGRRAAAPGAPRQRAGRGGAAPSGARSGPLAPLRPAASPRPAPAPPCPARAAAPRGSAPADGSVLTTAGAARSALYCNLPTVITSGDPSHLAESFYVN